MHCLYPNPQLDVVQLNAPKYNPDIDGQRDPVPDIQSSTASCTASTTQQSLNAENAKEDTASDANNSEQHTAFSLILIGLSLSPHQFWMIQAIQDTKTPNNQGQSTQVTTDLNCKTSQN